MPPDSTQVAEIVPLLKDFAAAVDLHGIWLGVHHIYDEEENRLHDPLSNMIVNTNLYLKMPASAYEGQRFIVILEPLSRRAWSTHASTAPTTWWWFHRWTEGFA